MSSVNPPDGWAPQMYDDIDQALIHIARLLDLIEEHVPYFESSRHFVEAEEFLEDFNG